MDTVQASFVNNNGVTIYSNNVTKTWSGDIVTNMYLSMNAPVAEVSGSTMTTTLYYNNFGGNPALNSILQATIPSDEVFISASDSGTFNSTTNTVTWDLGSVAAFPSGSGSETVTVSIPSSVPAGTVLTTSATVSTTTLETNYTDNYANASTLVRYSNNPINTQIGPIISYSNNQPMIYWATPTTFTYTDALAVSVEIIIHVNDGGPDIIGNMTGPAPTWTYTTTFYPRHGLAIATFIPQYPSGLTSNITLGFYIDPAGYVYDTSNNQRIQGATVTLQIPDGSGGWTDVPTGSPLLDPSTPTNPETTDVNGQYNWLTVAGTYRVHAEAPGYQSADSIVVNVPPAISDLSIGLTPLVSPTRASAASVWTTDSHGTFTNSFDLGQTVFINWNPSPSNGVVDIQVVDENNNTVFDHSII